MTSSTDHAGRTGTRETDGRERETGGAAPGHGAAPCAADTTGAHETRDTGTGGTATDATPSDTTGSPGAPSTRLAGVVTRVPAAGRRAATTLGSRWSGARLRTRIAAVVVAVVVLAGAVGGFAWWRATALPEGAAFRVGDRVVTVDELDQRLGMLKALYGVRPPTDPARLDRFRRDGAKSYVVAILLEDAAREQGVQVADKAANDALNRFVSAQLGEGPQARAQFVEALGNAGTSEQAVLGEVRSQMTVAQLMDRVTGDVPPVTDDDVRRAFDERHDQLGTPETRRISNIVVDDEATARSVAQRVRDGEPFAEAARSTSQDASTRDKGGDVGTVGRAQLEADYGTAAFAAPKGGVFGPVRTRHGWNVGRVQDIVAPVPARFDAVAPQLRAQLQLERATQRWRDWLGARIAAAGVVYADGFRPADPDAAPPLGPEPGAAAPDTAPQNGADAAQSPAAPRSGGVQDPAAPRSGAAPQSTGTPLDRAPAGQGAAGAPR